MINDPEKKSVVRRFRLRYLLQPSRIFVGKILRPVLSEMLNDEENSCSTIQSFALRGEDLLVRELEVDGQFRVYVWMSKEKLHLLVKDLCYRAELSSEDSDFLLSFPGIYRIS